MDQSHQGNNSHTSSQNELYSLQSLTEFLSKTKIKSAEDRHVLIVDE